MGLRWGHLSRSEWWHRHNLFSGRSVSYQQDNHIGWWLILQARRPNLPVLSNLTWSYSVNSPICHCILEIRLLDQHALSSPSLELLRRLCFLLSDLWDLMTHHFPTCEAVITSLQGALCEQKAQYYWGQILSCCKTASGKWGYSD